MGVVDEEEEMSQLRVAAAIALRCQDAAEPAAGQPTELQRRRLLSHHAVRGNNGSSATAEGLVSMECCYGEEQWLISSGSHRKYGSTSTQINKPERYVRYDVQPDDTLQGIALKHNVTMEQLKRANRLWTNDSLVLRRTLLVPLPLEGGAAATASSDSDDAAAAAAAGCPGPAHADSSPGEGSSAADFLRRVDDVIASSRRNVSRLQLGQPT